MWKALEKPRGPYTYTTHVCVRERESILDHYSFILPKFLRILWHLCVLLGPGREGRMRASVNEFADTFNYSSQMLCDNETGLKTDYYYCYVFILFCLIEFGWVYGNVQLNFAQFLIHFNPIFISFKLIPLLNRLSHRNVSRKLWKLTGLFFGGDSFMNSVKLIKLIQWKSMWCSCDVYEWKLSMHYLGCWKIWEF